MDDTKLKFLPRHMQRTQPAGSHKPKRRVTVENEDTGDDDNDRRKPSVFERLGPGASQRPEKTALCVEFQERGSCQYGKNCPYSHSVKTKGQSKRDDNDGSDDLRLKFKGQSGKDRESKVRSQVVVRKTGLHSDDDSAEDSDNWSIDKLASKKEMELERKRQEIQRALSALEATEDVDDHKKHSDSSESDSSPERLAKKKKEKASKKEKRKKHKKNAFEKEKSKDLKRKHDSEEEDSSQKNQKKRKKKKQKHADEMPRDPISAKPSKLLSPLKKVLKQKKGSEAMASGKRSKRHRSESEESRSPRRRPRSADVRSSSESSPSPSPVKRKKMSSSGRSHERRMKKRSRSVEKKRLLDRRDHRRSISSSSSSSSSSPSSSPSTSPRSQGRVMRGRKSEPVKEAVYKSRHHQHAEPVVPARKDRQGDRKKRDKSAESWNEGHDSSMDRATRGRQPPGQQEKSRRGRSKEDRYATPVMIAGKQGKRNYRDAGKGAGRHEGKESKEGAAEARGLGMRGGDWEKDEKKDKRGRGESGRDRDKERGGRQDKGVDRESRDRKASPERQERGGRRSGAYSSGPSFSQQSAHHGGQRSTDSDRDNRHFEDGGRFPTDVSRMSQYHSDRQRGPDRGDTFDRRDGSDSRSDRGPGRFNRGNDSGDGRGWDDRRHGAGSDALGRDDWTGRDRTISQFPPDEDEARDFGRRREDRRGGRDERLLPHLGDGDSSKDSRYSQMGDMRNQRGGGGHRDDFARDRMGVRDWKLRESSYDSNSRRAAGDVEERRSASRDQSRGGVPRSSNDSRQRFSNKEADKMKQDVSSKMSPSGMLNLKSQPVKEDSPVTRDEPSLASLFSQTETVAPVKKKPTKSFGGKKSPKKLAEDAKSDKTKSTLSTRLAARSRRNPEKKTGVITAKSGDAKTDEKAKDSEKSTKPKESSKAVKLQSPKGSHKSEDSPRSRHSQSRSRRSSKSPDSKRTAATRSSPSNRGLDSVKTDARLSQSPAPPSSSTRDRDKRDTSQRSTAVSSSRDRQRRDDPKDWRKMSSERGKKRERSRSHSLSEEESHHSPDDKKRRRSSDSDSMPAKLEVDIAAAMLGDGIDDGQQEEKVFSDWSDDDDADNILMGGDSRKSQPHMLMQAEDFDDHKHSLMMMSRGSRRPLLPLSHYSSEVKDIRPEPEMRAEGLKEKPALEKNIPNVKIVEDIQKEKPAREKRRDADNEGYEEISSDENELDEEGEKVNKRTIVSILDIDLSNLMPSSKIKAESGPVFLRYKAVNVFGDLGISQRFTGEKLYREIQDVCQKQLEEMVSENLPSNKSQQTSEGVSPCGLVKEEPKPLVPSPMPAASEDMMTEPILSSPETMDGDESTEQKPEISSQSQPALSNSRNEAHGQKTVKTEQDASQKPTFNLYSKFSAVHRFLKSRAKKREELFNNSSMLSRALTARRDLDIRRRLCKIPHNYDQSAIYPSGVIDPDLHLMCQQLFKRNRPLALPKDLPVSCS